MVAGLGPLEITVLVGIFFVLFGAERLPKMANALGRSKGEFEKGLTETKQLGDLSKTTADLEAGGRTPEQLLDERAEAVGMNPEGMEREELERKVEALEAMNDQSEE
jgi:sec-independent protein translocase protein TatA